jgi:hypothetical protein
MKTKKKVSYKNRFDPKWQKNCIHPKGKLNWCDGCRAKMVKSWSKAERIAALSSFLLGTK